MQNKRDYQPIPFRRSYTYYPGSLQSLFQAFEPVAKPTQFFLTFSDNVKKYHPTPYSIFKDIQLLYEGEYWSIYNECILINNGLRLPDRFVINGYSIFIYDSVGIRLVFHQNQHRSIVKKISTVYYPVDIANLISIASISENNFTIRLDCIDQKENDYSTLLRPLKKIKL